MSPCRTTTTNPTMATAQQVFFLFTCSLLLLAALARAEEDSSDADIHSSSATTDFHPTSYQYSEDASSSSSYVESLWQAMADTAEQFGAFTMIIAVTILDVVPFVPTQPAAVVVGAVLGFPSGLPVVIVGQALATAIAMWIGRHLLAARPPYSRLPVVDDDDDDSDTARTSKKPTTTTTTSTKLSRVLEEMASGLNSDDFKTVFGTILLARQSPVLPFSLGNYFIGASTKARVAPVVLATMVGCIPLNCVFVGAGAGGTKAMEALQEHDSLAKGVQCVGFVATSAILVLIGRVVYRVWKEDDATIKLEALSEKEKVLRDVC